MQSSPVRIIAVALVGTVFLGCAAKAQNTARTRAASDFSCPAEDVQLTQLTGNFNTFEYTAKGCEQVNQYQVTCGRYFVLCDAKSFGEIDRNNARADDYMKRTTGCHSNDDCLKYGDGLTCQDYVCK